MKSVKEMNGIEKIAYSNIKGIFEWNVGGWYNDLQDGNEEYIPSLDEAKKFVYEDALENYARSGIYSCDRAPREMRLAGKEFIMSVINHLFDTDGDAQALWSGQ